MAKQIEEPRHFQFSLRWLFLLVAVVAVGIWLVGNFAVVAVWSGRSELTLRVQSRSSGTIKSISYATYFKLEYAQIVSKEFREVYDFEFEPVIEVDGKTLAHIPCGGRTNPFGYDISYVEKRYVVLHVQYANGQEHRTLFEVPPGRGPRSVTVTVP